MRTKPPRRFAQGTTVDVAKTRVEVEALLTKHGASQTLIGADAVVGGGFVHFALDGRQYRLLVPKREGKRNEAQLDRERWRALLLLLKAKLEIVASGAATIEQEFLAYTMLPNGKTLGAELSLSLTDSYKTGKMPKLLSTGDS